jgi:hypothetical protein
LKSKQIIYFLDFADFLDFTGYEFFGSTIQTKNLFGFLGFYFLFVFV